MRHPMFLISADKGTHEATRMFVDDKGCRCGDRLNDRLGPGIIERVEFSRDLGLKVTTSVGVIWSPAQDCQCTWSE